jgi:hypothetical protein
MLLLLLLYALPFRTATLKGIDGDVKVECKVDEVEELTDFVIEIVCNQVIIIT